MVTKIKHKGLFMANILCILWGVLGMMFTHNDAFCWAMISLHAIMFGFLLKVE